ncbi:MAG: type 4a pilus biogenesis protein PilO [Armatimonadetes bacterium]|nr:type 4a pilus biogenesis protein PilO [Armatimonadota bacterium]
MFRIKPSKKSLLCLGVVAILLLLVCSFAYWNLAGRHGVLNKQIVQKEQKLSNSEVIMRRLYAVEQDYMDAQTKLGALEQGVSTKSYVPTLLRQIEELGKSVNMRVVGVRPKPAVAPPPPPTSSEDKKKVVVRKPDPYDKLDIDVEVKGKYADVMQFLHKITSFPKIIAVNSVQISPEGGQKEELASPLLSVRLGTTAFILKESAKDAQSGDSRKADAGSERT